MGFFGNGSPSYGSLNVNGQLVPVVAGGSVQPANGVGPTMRGYGQTPPSTIPAGVGTSTGRGSGPLSTSVAMGATSQPFSFVHSPLPLLLAMLVIGLIGLRYIHFRG